LISNIPGKTIVFGNSLSALESITPNVVSSNNTDKQNDVIRKNFDTGKTNIIASFKKLKQGANLVGLDNVIIHSYYSKSKDLIQRIGRLRQNGEIGRVFIFVTFGTQESKWYDMMFEDTSSLNIINCNTVDDCLVKLT
jgi:ERCC4-related helicase